MRRVLAGNSAGHTSPLRPGRVDPYRPFLQQALTKFPILTSALLLGMLSERGYVGSASHLRHLVAGTRPRPAAEAFAAFGDCARVVLYDKLKSAVLERQGDAIRFNPVLLEFAAHYRYEPRPVNVAHCNEKDRVERAILYERDSFFAARADALPERTASAAVMRRRHPPALKRRAGRPHRGGQADVACNLGYQQCCRASGSAWAAPPIRRAFPWVHLEEGLP